MLNNARYNHWAEGEAAGAQTIFPHPIPSILSSTLTKDTSSFSLSFAGSHLTCDSDTVPNNLLSECINQTRYDCVKLSFVSSYLQNRRSEVQSHERLEISMDACAV